jgi:hypothetical protein
LWLTGSNLRSEVAKISSLSPRINIVQVRNQRAFGFAVLSYTHRLIQKQADFAIMKPTHCSYNATKYRVGLISLLLLAFAAAANAQDSSSAAEAVLSKVIGSKGGSIEIAERVRIAFPEKFFSTPQTVSVRISGDPTTDNALPGYELHSAGRGPYLPFDVLVEADQEPQGDYELTITLPVEYLRQIPAHLKPTAFREVLHGSEIELHYLYEGLLTRVDVNDRQLYVKVPKLKFYRLEQLYDTIIVGCVPR